jgi:transaldolase
MPADGGDAEEVLGEFTSVGIDHSAIAADLQREGAESFDKSWNDLMDCVRSKSEELKKAS